MARHCLLFAAVATLLSGCSDCNPEVDPVVCDAFVPPVDAPMLDAPVDAALIDAMPDAEPPDAMPALCTSAADTADHLEPLGGSGGAPQMTVDGFGAAAMVRLASGTRIARLGADGQRRAADLDVAIADPYAIAFDGLDYVVSERVGTDVQVRTVSTAGVLGTPVVIGAGVPLYGALAVHASGDWAVMWRATVDGSIRITVVPAAGSPVTTVLDTPAFIVSQSLVGGVIATEATGAKFVAAYARVNSASSTSVMVQRISPNFPAVPLSPATEAIRQRVAIHPGVNDTALITWSDGAAVHVATYHPLTGITLFDQVAITPGGSFFTRVGARVGPGNGFEVLVDHNPTASDRGLFLYTLDAAGDPVGEPVRIASICTNAYSEENLAFVRVGASVRYVTWHDMTLPDNIAASF